MGRALHSTQFLASTTCSTLMASQWASPTAKEASLAVLLRRSRHLGFSQTPLRLQALGSHSTAFSMLEIQPLRLRPSNPCSVGSEDSEHAISHMALRSLGRHDRCHEE